MAKGEVDDKAWTESWWQWCWYYGRSIVCCQGIIVDLRIDHHNVMMSAVKQLLGDRQRACFGMSQWVHCYICLEPPVDKEQQRYRATNSNVAITHSKRNGAEAKCNFSRRRWCTRLHLFRCNNAMENGLQKIFFCGWSKECEVGTKFNTNVTSSTMIYSPRTYSHYYR